MTISPSSEPFVSPPMSEVSAGSGSAPNHDDDRVLIAKPARKRPPEKVMMYAGLLMPLFMMILLPLLYTWGLHSPSPQHMSVAIVGASEETSGLANGTQAKVGSSFDIGVIPDVESARAAVAELEIRAAYDPSTNTVYVASLGNLAAKEAATAVLTGVAQGVAGAPPIVVDLAPAPAGDMLGNTTMFMAIAAIMGGFLTATVMRLLLPDMGLRVELAVLAVMSAISGIVPMFIAFSVYSALSANALGVGFLLSAFAFVIGAFHLGGMRLIGPAMVLPTIIIMLLFGVPASGGAIAPEMVPGFFTNLHSVLPTPALIEGLKRLVYFPDAPIGSTMTTLAVWGVMAAALLALAAVRHPAEEEPLLESFAAIPDPVEEPVSEDESVETHGASASATSEPAATVDQGASR